jgi:hypothetical protein
MGLGTLLLRGLITHLQQQGSERLNIAWMPVLKGKAADPQNNATRFFMDKFSFRHGREVAGVFEFLTVDIRA